MCGRPLRPNRLFLVTDSVMLFFTVSNGDKTESLYLHTRPPAHLHKRFALLFRRILHQVLVQRHLTRWIEDNDCTPTVIESSQALPSTHMGSNLVHAWDVLYRSHEHGSDGDYSNRSVCRGAADDHDRALVLAEDVEGAFLVDGLRVSTIIMSVRVACRVGYLYRGLTQYNMPPGCP
jgi:hypothetical protein